VASANFTPSDPGVLRGGSRFKALTNAVDLPKGFKGSIVARGYGPEEKAGTTATASLGLKNQDGGGSLFFPGVARSGPANQFPESLEPVSGTAYAAALRLPHHGGGRPGQTARHGDPRGRRRGLVLANGGEAAARPEIPRLAWPPRTALSVRRGNMDTVFVETGRVNGETRYYRVRLRWRRGRRFRNGQHDPDSSRGVPYVVPENTEGTQAFGGSIGNDFDVVRPLRITQLGVFDDTGDGLKRTIKCRIYDRVTRAELALRVRYRQPGELAAEPLSRWNRRWISRPVSRARWPQARR
jgi:hypothetical protein